MPAGRPLKIQSVAELQEKIDAYFKQCKEEKEPLTITGLGLVVGLSRKQLIEYTGKKEFRNTIKTAKQKIENYAEIQLFKANPTGPIFALKNYGWSDKQEHEHSGPGGKPIENKWTVEIIKDANDTTSSET
jgi:hypothetical protein